MENKKSSESIIKIKRYISVLNDRLNGIYQMMNFIDEYHKLKDKIDASVYAMYFAAMYSYIERYVVLEFQRMNDNDRDCVSINELRSSVMKDFGTIFPKSNPNLYRHKYCNYTQDEMKIELSKIFSPEIKKIQEVVRDIRNKSGLAHGQEESFGLTVTIEELNKLKEAYKNFLWMIDERLNNSHFAFGEGIIHYKGLSDLVACLK